MPRVRIICQNCKQQLSYLEMAPRWTVRATCPSCGAVTTATLNAAGEPCLTTTPVAVPAKRAAAGGERSRLNGRHAG